jgi:hypothetical protein
MTALQAFVKRNAGRPSAMIVAGMVGVALFAGSASVFSATPSAIPTHLLSHDAQGAHLVQASSDRLANQFGDLKRILSVIDDIADRQINGADKMRAVTQAARRLASLTPDNGAAGHDKHLFVVADAVDSTDFDNAVDLLNKDKMDLARASLSLRRIQNALLVNDAEAIGTEMFEMEAAIDRYDTRHPGIPASADSQSPQHPIRVLAEDLRQHVEIERNRIDVEITHSRVDVVRSYGGQGLTPR